MHASSQQRPRIRRLTRLHPLSIRLMFLRTRRRSSRWAVASLLLLALLASTAPHAWAVAPYRGEEDYGPSRQAVAHRQQCRDEVRQLLNGKVESEEFVARVDREYFRYVVRRDLREIMVLCDARTGDIRRQIDLWGEL